MSPKFVILSGVALIEMAVVFGWMRDFTLFTVGFLGASIPITFSQFMVLSSLTVLLIRGDGRGR